MNKTLKVMTSAALLAGVVAPVAVTTVDAANTKNIVNKVKSVDDDFKSETSTTTDHFIRIQADDMPLTSGDTFRLSLSSGAEWLSDDYDGKTFGGNVKVVSATSTDVELQLTKTIQKNETINYVQIPLWFEVDGAEGEVKVTVDPRDSSISGGTHTIAVVGKGSTTASIASVKTIKDGGEIDTIRIDENSIGALYDKAYETQDQEITLTLPSNFDWTGIDTKTPRKYVEFGGGLVGTTKDLAISVVDGNKLKITFKFKTKPTKLGTIYVKGLKIDADKNADFGEIEVDIDGDEVTSDTLVVAKYSEYGTVAELKGDVPTLLAGRLTDDKKDVETVEVLIKEAVAGSWLPGRSVDIEFPTWVKVIGVDVSGAKGFKDGSKTLPDDEVAKLFTDEIDGDSNEISFDLPSTLVEDGKKEFKVKFYVSSKADAEGDVTVKISGRAGIEVPETTVAKVVAPVKVETEKVKVRTGIKKQALGDIVITEAVKGALREDGKVQLKLSDGVFADEEPEITVEEGNVKIDKESIDVKDNVLTFEIDTESTRASKIKISGLSVDLSRAVPEGDITVEVGGESIVQNQDFDSKFAIEKAFGSKDVKFGDKQYTHATSNTKASYDLSGDVDAAEFDRDYVAKVAVATVVTPAEGNTTVEPVVFTIGSTTYKVGDEEKTMDAAPFVEAGRTYMPLRYVAEAVGVKGDNIIWDQANQTATFIKDGRVAQVKVGSKTLLLNGASITMDAAAQVKDGRTYIPVRFVAQALGASVDYNAADNTVTVK